MAIKYEYILSIVEKQSRAEQELLAELRTGEYTMEKPLVRVNPYLIAPLTAVVLFKTERPTAITVSVWGKEPEGTISHTFPAATEHILPVLGLYENYENTVTLSAYMGVSVDLKIVVPALETGFDRVISMETTAAYMKKDLVFLSPSIAHAGDGRLIGVDYRGDLRWCTTLPLSFAMKRLKNGNIVVLTERLEKPIYYTTGLYELSLAGKIVREFSIPGAYHHDVFEMEDGNLLALTEDFDTGLVEDQVVLLSRQTGEVLHRWDFKDFLRPGDSRSGSWSEADWFHNNAVWYDKNDNTLTLSGRHMDAIVNIDYDTGKLNWILGDPEGWPLDMQKYFFRPIGEVFDWQYEQHACLLTDNGDVMCFDNGQFRSKIPEKRIRNCDNFSRGVRYRLDRENMTIRQVWEYGKELKDSFFSKYISNVAYYGEEHYLVHSGGIILRNGRAVDGRVMPNDTTVENKGITVELYYGKVMLRLETRGNSYRAIRLPLYHDGDNLPIGNGVRLGKLAATKRIDIKADSTDCEPLPQQHEGCLTEEDDRFVFSGVFRQGQTVSAILVGPKEQVAFSVPVAKNALNASASGKYITDGAVCVTHSINKTGLSGEYELFIHVDGVQYATGRGISC